MDPSKISTTRPLVSLKSVEPANLLHRTKTKNHCIICHALERLSLIYNKPYLCSNTSAATIFPSKYTTLRRHHKDSNHASYILRRSLLPLKWTCTRTITFTLSKIVPQSTADSFNANSAVPASITSKAKAELWFSRANDAACKLVARTTHYLRSIDTKYA